MLSKTNCHSENHSIGSRSYATYVCSISLASAWYIYVKNESLFQPNSVTSVSSLFHCVLHALLLISALTYPPLNSCTNIINEMAFKLFTVWNVE